MAPNKQLTKATKSLKEGLDLISAMHGNMKEDIVPLFKLNQLRYLLSNSLNEVENIFKLYAQYDTPLKLFNATWAASSNLSVNANDVSKSETIKNSSITSGEKATSTRESPSLSQSTSNADNQVIFLSDDEEKKPDLEKLQSITPVSFNSESSSQTSCKSEIPKETVSDSQVENGPVIERKNKSKVALEAQALLTSLESLLTSSEDKSPKNNPSVDNESFRKSRFNGPRTSNVPSLMSVKLSSQNLKPRSSCNWPKYFSVIKNQTHFSVIRRKPYQAQAPELPPFISCKMCGYSSKRISQLQKTYYICRRCKYG